MTTTTGRRVSATSVDVAIDSGALLADTDRCVKCALCLPACPTYQMARTETRSPRGRIAIVQGLASGQITPQEAAPALDSCLACRACENVCPANVPYGSILDRARTLTVNDTPRSLDHRLAAVFESPRLLRTLATLQRWSHSWPLPRRLRRWGAMTQSPRPLIPALDADGKRGTVYLASGCVTRAFDPAANESLAALLRACGYTVQTLHGCCGALAQHSGHPRQAQAAWSALAAGATDPSAPIVHAASGCAAALRDAKDVPSAGFGARVVDPFELLSQAGIKDKLRVAANKTVRVALHRPCTQRNVLGGGNALRSLLDELALEVIELTGEGCCGAAGTHLLTHAAAAQALGKRLLAPVSGERSPDVLLSGNIGCAWHLRGILFDRDQKLDVEHPAVFLARFLPQHRSSA